MNAVYDLKYFHWQKNVGEFGGRANLFKFQEHVQAKDVVLDFGCGGGYLLKNLNCSRRVGVEVNEAARSVAAKNGIECYDSLDAIAPASVNVIITNHALEHVNNPFQVLMELRSKLVCSGLLVVVVPCEATIQNFDPNDINQHLYTWNPQLLGNLAKQTGFLIENVFPVFHKWPKHFTRLQALLGWSLFHAFCKIWGRINRDNFQVKLVARNPSSPG